ncbi:proline/serine-rich coiled-coil protein 1 [Emydura macquarii macquarii]|uniref:proline/serine-rich coiled-coil protein 1 n=1 Tax=Emydura macquarii macquarii TaxID=1129001 RepID=UPI00352A1EE6
MEMAEEEDIKFITDEKLDFGLSSPSDSREEERIEEEVVSVSPAQPVERCVARRIDLNVQKRESVGRNGEGLAHWSPLSAEGLEEIVKEANRLAVQLERCSLREKENASARLQGEAALSPAGEPLASLQLLYKERASPRSPRRETFVVKNSPVRALLPTVEPALLLPPGKTPSPCTRAAPTPPYLRHKLGNCSAGSERLRKKSTPSKAVVLSPAKRSPSSKKLSLQDPPRSRVSPTVGMKGPTGPTSSPARPSPAPAPSPRGRAEPAQKTSAGCAKASSSDAPQLPASVRPARGARVCQTQARSTAGPGPMSRLPVPAAILRPASRVMALSRAAAPGRPSQPQTTGQGSAGGRARPSAAGQRGPVPQRTAPLGSRLQLPRKVTLPSSPSLLPARRRLV